MILKSLISRKIKIFILCLFVFTSKISAQEKTLDLLQSHISERGNTATVLTSSSNPSVFGQPVTFTATVKNTMSLNSTPTGILTFIIDGKAQLPSNLIEGQAILSTSDLSPDSPHTITAVYSGGADFNFSTSPPLTQMIKKAQTTTSFLSSINPSVFGQLVKFTALVNVVEPGEGLPTGQVLFTIDDETQVSIHLTEGQATFSTSELSSDSHRMTATYQGDSNFISSKNEPLVQVVKEVNTQTSLVSSINPSVFGQPIIFTAKVETVFPGVGVPEGTIIFIIDGEVQKAISLVQGEATLSISNFSANTHQVHVVYNGDANFLPSKSASLTQIVEQSQTTISLASSNNPIVFGQSIALTATVESLPPGSGTSSGNVIFNINGVDQPAVPLIDNNATLSIPDFSANSYEISVKYEGNANFLPSTSKTLKQIVKEASTKTNLISSVNPSVFGQLIMFTARIESISPGESTPTGVVAFVIDGEKQIEVPLIENEAVFLNTQLPSESHRIIAIYQGDNNYLASTSKPLMQDVHLASTRTILQSSANPILFGQPVTLSAKVESLPPASGVPTGSVTFSINGQTQLPIILVGGQAVLFNSRFYPGSYVITATYSRGIHFNASTSEPLEQVVNRAKTQTKLISSTNPILLDELVVFTTIVESLSHDIGMPTGNVRFTIDGKTYPPVNLVNGRAILSVDRLSASSHQVRATYEGNRLFDASNSEILIQIVHVRSSVD